VLPALVDELDAVAVWVEHVSGIIARIVVKPRARRADVGRARHHRGGMGRIDLGCRVRDEPEMCRPALDHTRPQPEEYAPLAAEAFEVGMTRRPVLALVIDAIGDPERRHFGAERRNSGINDGVAESTHRAPHQRGPQTRRRNDAMVWSTPEVREVCVGMEVTSYLSAEM
jgi:coenzyme PQQ precursor peptide PqqA